MRSEDGATLSSRSSALGGAPSWELLTCSKGSSLSVRVLVVANGSVTDEFEPLKDPCALGDIEKFNGGGAMRVVRVCLPVCDEPIGIGLERTASPVPPYAQFCGNDRGTSSSSCTTRDEILWLLLWYVCHGFAWLGGCLARCCNLLELEPLSRRKAAGIVSRRERPCIEPLRRIPCDDAEASLLP